MAHQEEGQAVAEQLVELHRELPDPVQAPEGRERREEVLVRPLLTVLGKRGMSFFFFFFAPPPAQNSNQNRWPIYLHRK